MLPVILLILMLKLLKTIVSLSKSLMKNFAVKKKPSVRFDIDDLNGNGDSITNVTSITSIKATDVSITYIGEYSNGYPYSKRFKCNPKFETIDEDKFEYSVSMKLAGRGLPSAFELRSSAQLYEPTTPSPAPTSMSEQGLVLVICFSVGIPLLLSMICSSGVYAYWRFVKGKKAATKQSAEATADNKVVSVESGINTKSPKKETPRSQKDRDAEAQKDKDRTETKDDESERKKKKKAKDVSRSKEKGNDSSRSKKKKAKDVSTSKKPKIDDSALIFDPNAARPARKVSRDQNDVSMSGFPQNEVSRIQSKRSQ